MLNLSLQNVVVIIFSAFVVVAVTTPLAKNIAIHFDVLDRPIQKHKTHREPIPYFGGLAIVVGVCFVSIVGLILTKKPSNSYYLLGALLIPAIIMSIVGLIDDIKHLSPLPRFFAQNIVGVFIVFILVRSGTIGSPSGIPLLDIVVSMIWIVGLTNALNFFDNVDGGAAGTAAISSFGIVVLAQQSDQVLISAFSLVVLGGMLGFLAWNKPPARIYMGDAGSLFLGTVLASLTIRIDPTPINKGASLLIPLLLLAMPVLDTSVAVLSRLQRGASPFLGGKDHLSHRLLELGLSKRFAVILLWSLQLFYVGLAICISYAPYHYEGIISVISVIFFALTFIYFLKLPYPLK